MTHPMNYQGIERGFSEQLRSLAAREATAARGDPERYADMIETLSRALGFTVALASEGDPKTIDTMLEGATAYAHAEAVEKAPLAALTRLARRAP